MADQVPAHHAAAGVGHLAGGRARLEQLGLELDPVIYSDNNEVTKRLVLEGAGVGIVSNVVVRINVRVGNLKVVRVKLDEGELRRIFWLIYPKQVSNPAAAALIDQLLS
jgi:DNA-binding transcriptional LysR family regulator